MAPHAIKPFHIEVIPTEQQGFVPRADPCQLHVTTPDPTKAGEVFAACEQLCTAFFLAVGPTFLRRLNEFETRGREKGLTPHQAEQIFASICTDLDSLYPSRGRTAEQTLRPLFLEMQQRLFGSY